MTDDDKPKRERGTYHLVTQSGVEEYKTKGELKKRLETIKEGDMVALIRGKRVSIETKMVKEVTIA